MTRRELLSALGITLTAWQGAAIDAADQNKDEKKTKPAIVTLAITGMT